MIVVMVSGKSCMVLCMSAPPGSSVQNRILTAQSGFDEPLSAPAHRETSPPLTLRVARWWADSLGGQGGRFGVALPLPQGPVDAGAGQQVGVGPAVDDHAL